MKKLVEYVIQNLVDTPEKISITETVKDAHTELKIHVEKADRGKIIGKQGRTARAMRALLTAAAGRTGGRARLEILD